MRGGRAQTRRLAPRFALGSALDRSNFRSRCAPAAAVTLEPHAPHGTVPMIDVTAVRDYHAHVYYDAQSRPAAARVRDALSQRFGVALGRWHDRPVGPHPQAMYQVAFAPDQFAAVVPWLMLNREGLDILVDRKS